MNEGQKLWQEVDGMFNGSRSTRRMEWVDAVRYVLPDLILSANLTENNTSPKEKRQRLCPQARTAVTKLTSAYLSYITPIGHKWFKYEPWGGQKFDSEVKKQDAEDWYNEASDILFDAIEKSNLYNELFAVFTDCVATGTGVIFCDIDEDSKEYYFKHIPAGTFGLDVDHKGKLNRVCYKFKLTAAQIAEKFPNVELPQNITAALQEPSNARESEFELVHYVKPRRGGNEATEEVNPLRFPYASYYVLAEGETLLYENGYREMPYAAIRFQRVGSQVYGTSPLIAVMDYIDDLRTLDSVSVEAAKRRAIPPVLIPPEMRGQVALGAGQQTIVPRQYNNSALPREWALSGDTRELIDQRNLSNEYLKDALFITFLEVISSQPREMTAYEVRAREAEKLMAYAQIFAQFVCDWKPMQLRIFSLGVQNGLLNLEKAPDGVIVSNGEASYIELPKVSYIGRMSQALERAQLSNMDTHVARVIELAQATQNAELLMNYDWNRIVRAMAIMDGVPAQFLLPMARVEQLKEELVAARSQQQNAETELKEAQAAEHSARAAEAISNVYAQ